MNERSRQFLLSTICIGIFLTAAKWAIAPTYRSYSPAVLPELNFSRWQLIASQPLPPEPADSRYEQLLTGQFYEYRRAGVVLRVELRDLLTTTGDVSQLVETYLHINPAQLQFQDQPSETGYYRTFTSGDRAYLSSCISNHDATVTSQQFQHSRYQQAWRGDRLLQWALGKTSLIEQRCLWVNLSTPLNPTHPEISQAILREVWQEMVNEVLGNRE